MVKIFYETPFFRIISVEEIQKGLIVQVEKIPDGRELLFYRGMNRYDLQAEIRSGYRPEEDKMVLRYDGTQENYLMLRNR